MRIIATYYKVIYLVGALMTLEWNTQTSLLVPDRPRSGKERKAMTKKLKYEVINRN